MLVSRTIVSFPLHMQTLSKYKELVISSFIDNLHIFVYWAACPCCSCSLCKSARGLAIKDPWPLLFFPGQTGKQESIFCLENSPVLSLCFQTKPLLGCHSLTENWVCEQCSSAGKCPSWVSQIDSSYQRAEYKPGTLHGQDNRFSSLTR